MSSKGLRFFFQQFDLWVSKPIAQLGEPVEKREISRDNFDFRYTLDPLDMEDVEHLLWELGAQEIR